MSVPRIELAPGFSISRIIKGGWQLAAGHSDKIHSDPLEDMFTFADAGVTTFDCADIYTGVEELIGHFIKHRKRQSGEGPGIEVLTKFVPDRDMLPVITKAYVEKIIDRSLDRLGVERLDVVQFHWWDYEIPGMVETAHWLKMLQQAGKINLISGTNFDADRIQELIAAGIHLASLQIQYSLLDRRAETRLVDLCAQHKIQLLCYGTVAGGFLSDRWLGVEEPATPYENRSLVKYKLIIDEFGGWDLFQSLLRTLSSIGKKHGATITNVATRYVLDRKQAAGIIIGARTSSQMRANLDAFKISLNSDDIRDIEMILSQGQGPQGDVFALERVQDGPHSAIMKYNLNKS